jgi:transposase
MQDARIEPATRHGASCMGDGPHRWTRCAQDDNCCCGSRGRTFGRGTAVGICANRADVLRKMVERLARGGSQLSICYEAGPCGYGLHRFLRGLGHTCSVVAPSLIPIKAGERIKTNGRDAVTLARLHRALTEVWVPDAALEAMRDLVRARATAAKVLSKARQHWSGFLL